jgi:copper(I)-binding protein
MKHSLFLIVVLLLPAATFSHEVTVGTMQIIHANIPAPIPAARSAAGYMEIANSGSGSDTLLGIEVPDVDKVMLHTTEFGADGVARMRHVTALEIPANETVALEPSGYHMMLMGLKTSMKVGDMISGTLIFEHAGRIEIEFMVDPLDGANGHTKMSH